VVPGSDSHEPQDPILLSDSSNSNSLSIRVSHCAGKKSVNLGKGNRSFVLLQGQQVLLCFVKDPDGEILRSPFLSFWVLFNVR
jgi:hypothetical protein